MHFVGVLAHGQAEFRFGLRWRGGQRGQIKVCKDARVRHDLFGIEHVHKRFVEQTRGHGRHVKAVYAVPESQLGLQQRGAAEGCQMHRHPVGRQHARLRVQIAVARNQHAGEHVFVQQKVAHPLAHQHIHLALPRLELLLQILQLAAVHLDHMTEPVGLDVLLRALDDRRGVDGDHVLGARARGKERQDARTASDVHDRLAAQQMRVGGAEQKLRIRERARRVGDHGLVDRVGRVRVKVQHVVFGVVGATPGARTLSADVASCDCWSADSRVRTTRRDRFPRCPSTTHGWCAARQTPHVPSPAVPPARESSPAPWTLHLLPVASAAIQVKVELEQSIVLEAGHGLELGIVREHTSPACTPFTSPAPPKACCGRMWLMSRIAWSVSSFRRATSAPGRSPASWRRRAPRAAS